MTVDAAILDRFTEGAYMSQAGSVHICGGNVLGPALAEGLQTTFLHILAGRNGVVSVVSALLTWTKMGIP